MKKHPFQKYFFVLGGCGGLAAACLGMISNVNGIFFAPVSESLGTGLGTVSLNATLTALATGFASPAAVRLVQKGRFKTCMLASSMATALATAAMAFPTRFFCIICSA